MFKVYYKGSSWLDDAGNCRSAIRIRWLSVYSNFFGGFRIVLKGKANG